MASDLLVDRLVAARAELAGLSGALNAGEVDAVRRSISNVATLQTIKGYLGVSVKSRAIDLGDAGQKLKELRGATLVAAGGLDSYCFQRQVGNREAAAAIGDPAELLTATLKCIDDEVSELQERGK